MNRRFEKAGHAALYNAFRFEPPKELTEMTLEYLGQKIQPPFQQAVDVGCGTGQSTVVLAPHFKWITGVDISEAQIENALKSRTVNNITYKVGPAEALPLPDCSVQLVNAGACIHWLDLEKFFAETKRVLALNGVLASHCNHSPKLTVDDEAKTEQLNQAIKRFTLDDLEMYKTSGTKLVIDKYRDIEFPFADIERKDGIKLPLTLMVSDLISHFKTYSPYQIFKEKDPEGATKSIETLENSIMKILEAETPPEETEVQGYINYFIVLCRKTAR